MRDHRGRPYGVEDKEKQGVIICKYAGRLRKVEIDRLKQEIETTYGKNKKVLLISDQFDFIDIPFIKIDAEKIQEEAFSKCEGSSYEQYIETLFKMFVMEVNKQLRGDKEADVIRHHHLCNDKNCFISCSIAKAKRDKLVEGFAESVREKTRKRIDDSRDKEVLEFLYARLIEKYKEDKNVDYMKRFKEIIDNRMIDDLTDKIKIKVKKKTEEVKAVAACADPLMPFGVCYDYIAINKCGYKDKCIHQRELLKRKEK